MLSLETVETPHGGFTVAQATPEDIQALLAVFDDAVSWLNSQGNTRQWGTTPFSSLPHMVARFEKHLVEDNNLFLAALKGEQVVGALAVNLTRPDYCWQGASEEAAYVHPFATHHTVRRQGVGSLLLRRAEQFARQNGKTLLRLDCFADSPKLCAYYEGEGFLPRGEFHVGGWRGQMYEKRVAL